MPDFTIAIEDHLKRSGIQTVHYISPSVWAWRKNRIFKIGRATDNILVFLPFENDLYNQHNISCKFIGHAMADSIPLDLDKVATKQALGIPCKERRLALLPGSRKNEVAMLSVDFLLAAEKIYRHFFKLEIVVPLVNLARQEQFESIRRKVTPLLPVRILDNQASQAMIASDIALLA